MSATPQPPRHCRGCVHWEAFPIDGLCCADLAHLRARCAEGARRIAAGLPRDKMKSEEGHDKAAAAE
jgi:hypothetical protein